MTKVLIRGYYDFNNFGDDALLYSLIHKIFSDHNEFEITVISNKHTFAAENIKYTSTNKINILKQIIYNDLLVFGGGSQFQDFGTIQNFKGLLFKILMITVAKLTNTKIIHLGISIGPFKTKIGLLLAKITFANSDLTIVRDSKSLKFLKEQVQDKSEYHQLPDLTCLLHENERNFKKDINIGFNLLPFHKTTNAKEEIRNQVLDTIKKTLSFLEEKHPNVKITFFSFQNHEKLSDLEEIKKVVSNSSLNIVYEGDVDAFNNKIKQCTHFVSMRFHAAVFAYLNEIPQINLAYHPKCTEFMKEVCYPEDSYFDIQKNDLSPEKFLKNFKRLLESPELFTASVEPVKMKEKLKVFIEQIENKLKVENKNE